MPPVERSPRRNSRRGVLLLALAAALGAACRSRIANRPASVRATPWVDAPAGAALQRARVEVRYTPERRVGRGYAPARVEHWLVLSQGGAEREYALEGVAFHASQAQVRTSPAERSFGALIDARYALRFAGDGHALGLSTDDARTFRYVALDAVDAPLYCRHRTLRALTPGGDPFADAPDTRALALEILAATDPPPDARNPHIYPGEPGPLRDAYESEARGALRFACAHPDDVPARRAVAEALVRPGAQLQGVALDDALATCAGTLAARDEAVRARFVAALTAGDALVDEQRARARVALVASGVEGAQLGLAQALAARVTAAGDCGDRRGAEELAALSEATARITLARSAGGAPVREALEHAAQLDACAGYRHTRPLRQRARVMALRGLVALGGTASDAALAALAQGECPQALPAWPDAATGWPAQDDATRDVDVACFARAAQQRLHPGAAPAGPPDAR